MPPQGKRWLLNNLNSAFISSGCSQSAWFADTSRPMKGLNVVHCAGALGLLFFSSSSLVPPAVLAGYDHILRQFREQNQLKTGETTWKLISYFFSYFFFWGEFSFLSFQLSKTRPQQSYWDNTQRSGTPARGSRTNHFLQKLCQLEPVNYLAHWRSKQTEGFPDNSALAGNNASFLYASPQNTSFLKDLSLPPLQMFPSLSF